MGYKLNKDEKLCSRTAVNELFEQGHSVMAFPLRAVYRLRPAGGRGVQFLITIPKKRIRKAVGRVALRRRVREAYRLNRLQLLVEPLRARGLVADVAFIYLDNTPAPYRVLEDKMKHLLTRIGQAAAHDVTPHSPTLP